MVQVSRAAQPAAGGEPRCAPGSLPTNDPRARVCTVGHAIALATAQPPPTTTAKSKPTPLLPSTARASFERQAPTRADHEPVVDAAGDHADPGHPSRAAACPAAALHDLTSAGHSGRGNARTPDTGHRTADTWTLRRPHRTLDTGRLDRHAWTLVARTGHWTPDAGRGHRQGDEGTAGSGPPGPPRRATARWDAQTMFLWTAPAVPLSPWRLGGEATFQREIALALPCSCLVAPPGPSGASAHCCPRTVRVEIGRKAHGQVLWRMHPRAVLWRVEWCRYALVAWTELKALTVLTWSSTGVS